jgi:phage protein Gp37/Gp68
LQAAEQQRRGRGLTAGIGQTELRASASMLAAPAVPDLPGMTRDARIGPSLRRRSDRRRVEGEGSGSRTKGGFRRTLAERVFVWLRDRRVDTVQRRMADRSSIEWTQATWNPVTGCSKVSPGCAHCYAETFAERFRGVPGHPYEQGFDLRFWPARLDQPFRWKRPRLIFVNSMSDLFHEDIPPSYIERVFDVMARAQHHTFQVLTKRADRLLDLAPDLPWRSTYGWAFRSRTGDSLAVQTTSARFQPRSGLSLQSRYLGRSKGST